MRILAGLALGYVIATRLVQDDLDDVVASVRDVVRSDEFHDLLASVRNWAGETLRELASLLEEPLAAAEPSAADGDLVAQVRRLTTRG